ncbi:MAG: winged helix-turn-helix transcriptional regulator [Chlamydiia bacterium]|nr:winged helix-turn-helix transcriptional regulator [Chlamydiia bacterium]
MLATLFGNQNTEKILLFLFANGKCYGTQLHRILDLPLTPIQKTLRRLENGGLIMSHFEGKTRVYQFNPGFPLMKELEQLLQKSYTLLPAQSRKALYNSDDSPYSPQGRSDNKLRTLLNVWEKLSHVRNLTFNANSKGHQEQEWNGRGTGQVIVTKSSHTSLIYHEKGIWKGRTGPDVNFSNVFRWTLDQTAGILSLEHLRRGPDHPVFLFHLIPISQNALSSIHSHLSEDDTYFGDLHSDQYSLRLSWRVIGPKKNETIEYLYR